MTSSISDTNPSPTPFSPFSTHSGSSDLATSDESPDLGAFATVFRALEEFQPRSFPLHPGLNTTTIATASSLSPTELESDQHRGSTVWTHQPIASYLSISSHAATSRRARSLPPSEPPSSDTEGGEEADDLDIGVDGTGQPSLGMLAEALQFIQEERAKLSVQRDATHRRGPGHSSTSESAWPQPLPPRRKRRRKIKAKSLVRTIISRDEGSQSQSRTETVEPDADDTSSSSPEASSSSPAYFKSTPATPPHHRKSDTSASADTRGPRLVHSKSTPSLRSASVTLDPRVVRLRSLAIKLKFLFPAEADALSGVLSNSSLNTSSPEFIDPRGPAPQTDGPLIHVFIDYSNILIGFLTYLRRHPHHLVTNKMKHISHAALALILERGRPITRRVLAASSPLYQPISSAERLGYEARVYVRVPDTGGGADRKRVSGEGHWKGKRSSGSGSGGWSFKGHAHRVSGGGGHGGGVSTTESEPGSSSSAPPAAPARATPHGSSTRVRYREQGVDELLQLKLLQAIADVDVPPSGSTIVLATGDGNVGQFNEEGFLGCVRTALKKGWRVELYAWEGGLSRAWVREFAEAPAWAGKFRIVPMDGFGSDLLDG
ncbi:hypothetical protein FA95DRAFT_1516116 [Auriscalpium vulgare]|uniref:Uncharacterized protein n=1 Tax=Auriscalpium vulgare TaxID=40419 RepID=A0ACB8RZ84_9AGAM|nr:hypothetical protein FA95DRAFT_1516116 [Auriscalpium vulgare]